MLFLCTKCSDPFLSFCSYLVVLMQRPRGILKGNGTVCSHLLVMHMSWPFPRALSCECHMIMVQVRMCAVE